MTELSNQSFQSLYIDDQAKDTNDRIVLIEEMSKSLPEATGILNSLFKEKFYGMVIAGSTISLANFRANLYDYDKEHKLGASNSVSEILKKIVDVCYDCDCEVMYYKGPAVYDGIPEELKNVSISVYLRDALNVKNVDRKNAAYALNFKDFFDPKKLMKNLENKANEKWLKQTLEKKDLEDTKKLMDYLKTNEKSYIDLQKALKESGDVNPNNIANEIIHEMDIDKDLQHYLGVKYADLMFYDITCNEDMTRDIFEEAVILASRESASDRSIEIDKKIQDKNELKKKLGKDKEKDILEDIADLEEEKLLIDRTADKYADDILRSINLGIDKNNKKRVMVATSKRIPQEVIKHLRNWKWPEKLKVSLKDLENIKWISGKLSMKPTYLKEKDENPQGYQPKKEKTVKPKKEKKKIDPFTKM